MGLSYVSSLMITADIPFKLRPPHIRKTHNKMMSLYGSFLCVITDDYSTHALEAPPIVHKKDP